MRAGQWCSCLSTAPPGVRRSSSLQHRCSAGFAALWVARACAARAVPTVCLRGPPRAELGVTCSYKLSELVVTSGFACSAFRRLIVWLARLHLFFLRFVFAVDSDVPPSSSVAAPVGVAAPSCSFSALVARFVPLWDASAVVAYTRPRSACAAAPPISACSGRRAALSACRGFASGVGGNVSGVAGRVAWPPFARVRPPLSRCPFGPGGCS